MSQMEILSYVNARKNPLMKEIADFLNITPPSATALIDNLAKEKLLCRIYSKQDRRMVRLVITPKGRQTLERGLKKMKTGMKTTLSKLNKQEINNLIKIHEKLAKVLQKK